MSENKSYRKNLRFPEHTKEKLIGIQYYANIWFDIVRAQKTYIIDCYAGTGYCEIEDDNTNIKGTALISVDLFTKDEKNNFKVILINNNSDQCHRLEENLLDYIKKKKFKANLGSEIIIKNMDWKLEIPEILEQTSDGIRLFLLDPFGIKSIPWNNVENLIKNAKSEFGYKESGFEVLINWAWHKIRRIIGIYYKNGNNKKEFSNLDDFFGPVKWKEIVDKYPNTIFKNKNNDQIEKLAYDLVQVYVKHFFKYFKYVKIHPVHFRKKRKESHLKEKGKIKYFIIFASNFYDALEIIDRPFKESRQKKIFPVIPTAQSTLYKWIPKSIKNTIKKIDNKIKLSINDKIKRLEIEIGDKLYPISKDIIIFLYYRKSYDYGCPDFALYERFEINSEIYLPFLLEKKIIGIRKWKSKSGLIFDYYFLIHPILVDRKEYLFLNDQIFEHKSGEFIEIKNSTI
ncbi:MAG: three-Cys-motif partner protein TcmP [Promethearchaeota archaeon]|nr:MAG: three-Cys-motif partner protein TcmP [Candidatus Lokiarchaeota archaeon]